MNDVKLRVRRLAVLVITAMALLSNAVSAQGIPEEYTNLQILPEGIQRSELVGIMRDVAIGLGVRCSFCHMVSDALDSPEDDFASDDKETKLKAREMLRMVQAVNQDHIANLPARTEPNIEVTCVTCHSGKSRPTTLAQEMTWAAQEGGTDAMRARYAELRGEYYGLGAFNFGEGTLATVAQTLGRENPEVGMAAVELNLEYYPESVQTWMLKGQLHLLGQERSEAITALERALELSPGNATVEQLLERARGGLQH